MLCGTRPSSMRERHTPEAMGLCSTTPPSLASLAARWQLGPEPTCFVHNTVGSIWGICHFGVAPSGGAVKELHVGGGPPSRLGRFCSLTDWP